MAPRISFWLLLVMPMIGAAAPASGPLTVHPVDPLYFADGNGKPVYLAGANCWGNLQDGHGTAWSYGWGDPFDFLGYLQRLENNNLNYSRMWMYETAQVTYGSGPYSGASNDNPVPNPWLRTGPGNAADGKPKFDLSRYEQAYFDRMRSRAMAAGARGIYVSIMLFEGWSIRRGRRSDSGHQSWAGHPFNTENNINGINGDPGNDGDGYEIQTLQIPAVTRLQEAYVKKVIDTVNDLDNVLFEIANESPGSKGSVGWQYHMIDFIKTYEAKKPKQHPVGVSKFFPNGKDRDLFYSAADWIALDTRVQPVRKGLLGWWDRFRKRPYFPAWASVGKVIISDTDHYSPEGFADDPKAARRWAWQTFAQGANPSLLVTAPGRSGWIEAQRAMGDTRTYAEKMDLASVRPFGYLSSTGYCLAKPGREYLVYQPGNGIFSVELEAGLYDYEWFRPSNRKVVETGRIAILADESRPFNPPFSGDAVLFLSATNDHGASRATPNE